MEALSAVRITEQGLPCSLDDYMNLVGWTGRIVRKGKRGAIPRARLEQISDPRMAPSLRLKTDHTCLAFPQVACLRPFFADSTRFVRLEPLARHQNDSGDGPAATKPHPLAHWSGGWSGRCRRYSLVATDLNPV